MIIQQGSGERPETQNRPVYNSDDKESPCNAGETRDPIPGLGRSPGEGAWESTPVLLPREISVDREAQQATVHEGSQIVRPFWVTKHARNSVLKEASKVPKNSWVPPTGFLSVLVHHSTANHYLPGDYQN